MISVELTVFIDTVRSNIKGFIKKDGSKTRGLTD